MKPCLRCSVAKPYTEFFKNKNRKDGYSNECKACANERYKADPNGKAKRRLHADKWKQANPAATWAYVGLRIEPS